MAINVVVRGARRGSLIAFDEEQQRFINNPTTTAPTANAGMTELSGAPGVVCMTATLAAELHPRQNDRYQGDRPN